MSTREREREQQRLATIVSLVPFPIIEWKPGIYPGWFEIPPAKNNEPEILHVGQSIFWVELDENRSIQVKVPPDDLAQSIVNDYLVSNLEYNADKDCMPGIFWKMGKYSVAEVKQHFMTDIAEARTRQINWFLALVKLADDDWAKTHQHRSITDTQRYAAKTLNFEREWLISPKIIGNEFQKCAACATLVPKEAIVCSNCRCILDKKRYDELKFAEVR